MIEFKMDLDSLGNIILHIGRNLQLSKCQRLAFVGMHSLSQLWVIYEKIKLIHLKMCGMGINSCPICSCNQSY